MLLKYYSVVILCFSVVNGEPGEPKCFSRFDYDEKMLMKQLRFEDKVQKFEDFINRLKAREENEKEERSKLFAAELEKYKQENSEEVERQKIVTSEMLENVENSKMELENVHKQINEKMKGKVVAFTVMSPKAGATSDSMSFSMVITNEGNAFDTLTGKFTCPVSGLYYFSLHIIKKRSPSVSFAGCGIYLNGSNTLAAYTNPQDGSNGADNGSYGASTSVYLKLKVGDVVTLDSCNKGISDRVEEYTSFSGHLEQEVY
ncbi:heavy metal-binding protein HIP-like [Ruditapes philippinarum]|uniref:heavy metal-binding protein HIP-like n=1 Tax=Ruditapes philippinarum TaxID=129788 RepID=UPI00295B0F9B|nr:heavy metal-binding protein HIP-like [Ruditapes philippinarum]